jgi:hypothetical protein
LRRREPGARIATPAWVWPGGRRRKQACGKQSAGGLVTAMLVGAVGRIVALLEVIAGRKA